MKKNDCECCEIPEIKMFLTDCDGCLTDGGMYYSESGDEMKNLIQEMEWVLNYFVIKGLLQELLPVKMWN